MKRFAILRMADLVVFCAGILYITVSCIITFLEVYSGNFRETKAILFCGILLFTLSVIIFLHRIMQRMIIAIHFQGEAVQFYNIHNKIYEVSKDKIERVVITTNGYRFEIKEHKRKNVLYAYKTLWLPTVKKMGEEHRGLRREDCKGIRIDEDYTKFP